MEKLINKNKINHKRFILEASKGDFSKLSKKNFVEEVLELENKELGRSKNWKRRINISHCIENLNKKGEEKFKELYKQFQEKVKEEKEKEKEVKKKLRENNIFAIRRL
ncbi:MAG: hypothetical protein ACPLXS_02120 [Candidatus Micrarchaeales archaeon]